MDHSENRWLPPSPHREEVLRRVEAGRAHIEERGHSVPALLVFEDGGVIELPKVRYEMTRRGMEIVSADSASAEGQTKHNDVCGTIDEIKGLLKEQPDLASEQPEAFAGLLDDAVYMLNRMRRRCDGYSTFADGLASATERMAGITAPKIEDAIGKADALRATLSDEPDAARTKLEELYVMAESVRDVANSLENTLRSFKEATLEIAGLLDGIRGGRVWPVEEKSTPASD